MRMLESAILAELRRVEGNNSIRLKDISWALGDTLPEGYKREGDKEVHFTVFGDQKVVVAYAPKRKTR